MTKLVLFLTGLMACVQLGCGDDGDGDSPVDTDPGTDDSDMDAGDTEADSETEVDTAGGDFIVADENGNISGNLINGSWFTYGDATDGGNSTVTGTVSESGGYCAEGIAAEVQNGDDGTPAWATYWGAGIGFNLCQTPGAEGEDDVVNNIGNCPTNLSAIKGFKLVITGEFAGSQLRVTFAETDRNESTFIVALPPEAGEAIEYRFEDANVGYNPDAPPIDISRVQAIQFQISSTQAGDVAFDFCVDNVELILE